MHDHPTPPSRRPLRLRALRGLQGLLALLALVVGGLVVGAVPGVRAAASGVTCASVAAPPLPSFWCVQPGASVRVVGGQWGLNEAEGASVSVLWAQGHWGSVEVDGETVGQRVWLPMVGRGHSVVGMGDK